MNVTDALTTRYTARAFKPDPVDQQTLLAILGAATHAPSWANSQPWEVFVAAGEPLARLRRAYSVNFEQDVPRAPDIPAPKEWPSAIEARMNELRTKRMQALGIVPGQAAIRHWYAPQARFFDAPVIVFLCMDRRLTPWSMFDLGALTQSILLAAREHGLDSAAAFNFGAYPDRVRAELAIPDELLVVIGIALGHAEPQSPFNAVHSTRRPLEEVVRLKGL